MDQTSLSYVYVLSNPAHPGWIKVGCTDRSVEARRAELSSATGVLQPFVIEHVFPVSRGLAQHAERLAHSSLKEFKRRKEFFHCEPIDAVTLISAALKSISHTTFDVAAERVLIQQAIRDRAGLNDQIVRLHAEHAAEKITIESNYQKARTDLIERSQGQLSPIVRSNRLAAVIIALIVMAAAWDQLGGGWAIFVFFPLGLIWIPAVLWLFPWNIDGFSTFKTNDRFLQAQRDQAISNSAETLNRSEAALNERIRRTFELQHSAEERLRSFGVLAKRVRRR